MSELSLFDAIGEGKNATQDYLDTLSRALLRHHQLVKAIRIHGRYVPESLPMPGLPVLVAISVTPIPTPCTNCPRLR